MPNLKAILFARHILYEERGQDPSQLPEQIFKKLTLELLSEKTEVSVEVLKQAALYSSITGRTVTTALFFAIRTGLVENLSNIRFTLNLQDKVMVGNTEKLVVNSGIFGRSFMKNDLESLPKNTECLILFTHGPHCDFFPSVFLDCSGDLKQLSYPQLLQTNEGGIRWVNLETGKTGHLTSDL